MNLRGNYRVEKIKVQYSAGLFPLVLRNFSRAFASVLIILLNVNMKMQDKGEQVLCEGRELHAPLMIKRE